MHTRQESILRSDSPRSFRLIEIVNSQPEDVRTFALGTILRADGILPVVIEMVKNDPFGFIGVVREAMATPSPRGELAGQVRGQAIQGLIDDLRRALPAGNPLPGAQSRPQTVRDDSTRGSMVGNALANQSFLPETRRWATSNEPLELSTRAESRPLAVREFMLPRRSSRTPVGIDPAVFRSLPDHIRAELLALLPLAPEPSPQVLQGNAGSSGQSASQGTRPATETTSASSSNQAPAEDRVEEVSWPRINDWLQSRTGPVPLVLCVWCQEEVVISEGDLQPENGEREPSYQLPCSHIVGSRCLHNSLELSGVRVTRCPYCRADIGDVYG